MEKKFSEHIKDDLQKIKDMLILNISKTIDETKEKEVILTHYSTLVPVLPLRDNDIGREILIKVNRECAIDHKGDKHLFRHLSIDTLLHITRIIEKIDEED